MTLFQLLVEAKSEWECGGEGRKEKLKTTEALAALPPDKQPKLKGKGKGKKYPFGGEEVVIAKHKDGKRKLTLPTDAIEESRRRAEAAFNRSNVDGA